ncbi:MAG: type II toxin-antitoxin system HicA family toxin [Verrucomicrobiae bacterium]|nr:type II toxin-antitoxin system HicA family toxin [Verrucomicrobiae bacterium]
MKRKELLKHLQSHGCKLEREGASHSIWTNPQTGEHEAIPRHTEVYPYLAWGICRRLSVPKPRGK